MTEIFFLILDRYGWPAFASFAVAFALWRVARWFAQKIGEPLIGAHIGLVQNVQETNKANASSLGTQTELIKHMLHTQDEQGKLLQEIKDKLDAAERRNY
jgi:hypothetical protein